MEKYITPTRRRIAVIFTVVTLIAAIVMFCLFYLAVFVPDADTATKLAQAGAVTIFLMIVSAIGAFSAWN